MTEADLAGTIDTAWEARDELTPATAGSWRAADRPRPLRGAEPFRGHDLLDIAHDLARMPNWAEVHGRAILPFPERWIDWNGPERPPRCSKEAAPDGASDNATAATPRRAI